MPIALGQMFLSHIGCCILNAQCSECVKRNLGSLRTLRNLEQGLMLSDAQKLKSETE